MTTEEEEEGNKDNKANEHQGQIEKKQKRQIKD